MSPDGTRSEVQSLSREPQLECKHTEENTCHFTYVTKFESVSEEGRATIADSEHINVTIQRFLSPLLHRCMHFRCVKRFSRKSAR